MPAELARLHALLLELRRLAEGAGALCAVLRRTTGDAQGSLAGDEAALSGLMFC